MKVSTFDCTHISNDIPYMSTVRSNVRISVLGSIDAGKSTLLGVMTSGNLDDGAGKARQSIARFPHERATGKTSSVTHHSMGYALIGETKEEEKTARIRNFCPIFNTCKVSDSAAVKSMAWKKMTEQSEHVIDFNDNPGHAAYSSTAIHGLITNFADYAMLVVNSSKGIGPMTKEHWGVISALQIPLIVIMTKMDLVPVDTYKFNRERLDKYMKNAGRKAFSLNCKEDVAKIFNEDPFLTKWSPIVSVSVKEGVHKNVDVLHHFLSNLRPILVEEWKFASGEGEILKINQFAVNASFQVPNTGLVVSGVIVSGTVQAKTKMWLGPILGVNKEYGVVLQHEKLELPYHFLPVELRSIHKNRQIIETPLEFGSNCAIAIQEVNKKYKLRRHQLYSGVFLLEEHKLFESSLPRVSTVFEANVQVLHHSTSIQCGFQSVLFINAIRQAAKILQIKSLETNDNVLMLRSSDKANVLFQFLKHPALLHCGQHFVCRESHTKLSAVVTKIAFTSAELELIYSHFQISKHAQKQIRREMKQ